MSVQLTRQGFRLLADERSRNPMLDVYTNAAPQAWARASSQFEVGLAKNNVIVDIGNLSSVSIRGVDKANIDGGSLFAKTVAAADLGDTLTAETWLDGTQQHALFLFTQAEMNLLTSTLPRDIHVVITATTQDGEQFVCGVTTLTMVDDGAFQATPSPPENSGSAITVGDADARYAPVNGGLTNAPQITGTIGGGSTKLDGVATVGLASYTTRVIRRQVDGKNVYQMWALEPDTDDAAGAETVAPLDHDASTNPRSWRLRL